MPPFWIVTRTASRSKFNVPATSGKKRPPALIADRPFASGEAPLAVNNYDHLVQSARKRGAPVESLPFTPVVSRVTPVALGRYAPHPNIGKLFIDFSLSEEGQKILRGFGRSSARKGIEPDDLQRKGIKLYVSDISLAKDYARYDKEFKDIFGLK